jgi:hypothetical protein
LPHQYARETEFRQPAGSQTEFGTRENPNPKLEDG